MNQKIIIAIVALIVIIAIFMFTQPRETPKTVPKPEPQPEPEPEPVPEPEPKAGPIEPRCPGDANLDGKIDNGDFATIMSHASGGLTLSDTAADCADVTRDGVVNEADAICVDIYLQGDVYGWEMCQGV